MRRPPLPPVPSHRKEDLAGVKPIISRQFRAANQLEMPTLEMVNDKMNTIGLKNAVLSVVSSIKIKLCVTFVELRND